MSYLARRWAYQAIRSSLATLAYFPNYGSQLVRNLTFDFTATPPLENSIHETSIVDDSADPASARPTAQSFSHLQQFGRVSTIPFCTQNRNAVFIIISNIILYIVLPFLFQVIGQFTCLMTVATYLVIVVLIVIPQSAFFLLHTVLGLSEELAQMGLMPLIIFSFSTFPGLVLGVIIHRNIIA